MRWLRINGERKQISEDMPDIVDWLDLWIDRFGEQEKIKSHNQKIDEQRPQLNYVLRAEVKRCLSCGDPVDHPTGYRWVYCDRPGCKDVVQKIKRHYQQKMARVRQRNYQMRLAKAEAEAEMEMHES